MEQWEAVAERVAAQVRPARWRVLGADGELVWTGKATSADEALCFAERAAAGVVEVREPRTALRAWRVER